MMTTSAQKYSEAIAALTHRLTTWGVDDADTKARTFIHDLACQGWRAFGPVVAPPPAVRPARPEVRDEALARARAELRNASPPVTPTPTLTEAAASAQAADTARARAARDTIEEDA